MSSDTVGLDHVPFSVFADALQVLRKIRSDPRKSLVPPGNSEGRRTLEGGVFGDAGTNHHPNRNGWSGQSKEDVLTHLFKEVAGRISHSNRKGIQSNTKRPGTVNDQSFHPATALPERDTLVLLCLLAPQIDVEHPLWNMKATRIAEHYIEALDLRKNTADARWLLNFHDKSFRPYYATAPSVASRGSRLYSSKKDTSGVSRRERVRHFDNVQDGNFPSVLKAVLHDRCRRRGYGRLSLARIWHLLGILYRNKEAWRGSRFVPIGSSSLDDPIPVHPPDRVPGTEDVQHKLEENAVSNGENASGYDFVRDSKLKREARVCVFRELINEATAEENAEFARIILKDLEVRLPEDRLFRWFHPHAKLFFAQTHDLERLVKACQDPDFAMDQIQIEPGNYASVMLTARPTKSNLFNIARRLATGVDDNGNPFFLMEPKLDGERMQLHKIGSTIRTYTRSAKESTAIYGKLLHDVVCESVRANNAVLDGELIIWDESTNDWVRFENFRNTVTKIVNEAVERSEHFIIKYVVFDVLYIEHDKNICQREKSRTIKSKVSSNTRSEPVGVENIIELGDASNSANAEVDKVLYQSKSDLSTSVLPESISGLAQNSSLKSDSNSRSSGDDFTILQSTIKSRNSLVAFPLSKRRHVLRANVRNCSKRYGLSCEAAVEVIEALRGSSESDLTDTLGQFVDDGYEGLIAKSPSKPYGLAERNPSLAIKLKPDYFEGGLQDVDVVILGAKYGRGTGSRLGRIGTLSSFLIGARTHNSEEARQRYRELKLCKWTPVGCVGTGYSVDELASLQEQLEGHWHDLDRDRRNFPSFWSIDKSADYMFRDVSKWIDPRDSVVLQVRAYELVRNQGAALRFPRCDRIRDRHEKPFYDAISVDELIELDNYKSPAVIASANSADEVLESDYVIKPKKRKTSELGAISRLEASHAKVTRAGGGKRIAMHHETAADVSDITSRGSVLRNYRFQVLASHGQAKEKHEMERLIFKVGGSFDQSFVPSTTHYVALDPNHRMVQYVLKTARSKKSESSTWMLPILRPCWIRESVSEQMLVPLERRHLIYAPPELEKDLLRHTDRFGDKWYAPATTKSLIDTFQEIDLVASHEGLNPDIGSDDKIESIVCSSLRSSGLIFAGTTVFAPKFESSDLSTLKILLEFFGASTCHLLKNMQDTGATCYALVRESCASEDAERIKVIAPSFPEENIVSDAWVRACIAEGRLLSSWIHSCKNQLST